MFPVELNISKKKTILLEQDEGIMPTTKDGLAKLKTLNPGGFHTFGSQTHPADGNCGLIITTEDKAGQIGDPKIKIKIISYGYSRAKKGYMAMAVVPAAKMALKNAEISIDQVKTIKTHNPFAANDIYLADQFNIDVNSFNNFGSPIVFGHPQAPTAGRCIIEGIEETVQKGGGYLLWAGCAAGDTGGAIVIKVE
jgi:acetyl-CoA acetyltransferase